MKAIEMVDLVGQYRKIKAEIDDAVIGCIESATYIKGPEVARFEDDFANYLGVRNVISCANGTDALQIALMALDLKPGDEVIVPAFTYAATAEVVALLGLVPVMVDVDSETFNITGEIIEKALTEKTRAVVPVHLFGQSCEMERILQVAKAHGIAVIEDNAQAIGAIRFQANDRARKAGTFGDVGCTSFFPSKNLGCFGDGGALFTDDDDIAAKIRMIANHGQARKYYHSVVGVNSRLDTIQAAILGVKLKYLDDYCATRQSAARIYDNGLAELDFLDIPARDPNSTHVFHQYTMKVKNGQRDRLRDHLKERGVPSMIYYPLPLYRQEAFQKYVPDDFTLPGTEQLCSEVLSLPMHTELDPQTQSVIVDAVRGFVSR